MYIFCGIGPCPPLWEDWHDIIYIYSVTSLLVHLCGKIGMILYVYILWHRFLSTSVGRLACYYMCIFCGTGSCRPLWEDWHDIICIYYVAPVLVNLCGTGSCPTLWHRFLSTSVATVLVQLCGTGSCPPLWEECVYSVAPVPVHLCGTGSCPPLWQRFLSTSVAPVLSCPPLWEDWHDIICIYSVAPVLVHLCGKIGMILYVYILWHRFLSTSVGRLA